MMNIAAISARIKFSLFVLSPFCALLLIAVLDGCQQKPKEVKEQKPTITLENLQIAYTKALAANRMYTLFLNRAAKEKNPTMASLYKAVAKSEEIHANNHASLMKKNNIEPKTPQFDSLTVGNVLQSLKYALSTEDIEISSMYPNLIKTADIEKYKEAQTQFEQSRDVDARQEELLKAASEKNGKIAKTQYFVCPACGYIFDTDKTEECPICKTTKDKFIKN